MKETIKTSKNDNKTKNNNLNKSLDYIPKLNLTKDFKFDNKVEEIKT